MSLLFKKETKTDDTKALNYKKNEIDSEYVTDKDYSVGFELAKDYENIVITKTFSKVFGLAGLRIGWAYCPVDISKTLSTLKVPFSVNVAAVDVLRNVFLKIVLQWMS